MLCSASVNCMHMFPVSGAHHFVLNNKSEVSSMRKTNSSSLIPTIELMSSKDTLYMLIHVTSPILLRLLVCFETDRAIQRISETKCISQFLLS